MCLRFGTNPRQDFLGTGVPRQTPGRWKYEFRKIAATVDADHFGIRTRLNCAFRPGDARGTVKA